MLGVWLCAHYSMQIFLPMRLLSILHVNIAMKMALLSKPYCHRAAWFFLKKEHAEVPQYLSSLVCITFTKGL